MFLSLPLLGALLIWGGLYLLSGRVAGFVVLPIGIALLVISAVGSFELGETYSLVGVGTLITLIGMVLVNPLLAGPITSISGRTPTIIVIGLMGLAFGLAGIGAIVGAVIGVGGIPDAFIDATGQEPSPVALVIPLVVASIILLVIGYGVTRTAFGARGLAGRLARANAARNPKRTAITAASLMIGLTLVTATTIVGDSILSLIHI